MSSSGGIPGELGARTVGACARGVKRVGVVEELAHGDDQRIDVAAGTIDLLVGAHWLREPTDVVDDEGRLRRAPVAMRRTGRVGAEGATATVASESARSSSACGR